MHRKCENDPDNFCYICGIYIMGSRFKTMTPLVMEHTVCISAVKSETKTNHGPLTMLVTPVVIT